MEQVSFKVETRSGKQNKNNNKDRNKNKKEFVVREPEAGQHRPLLAGLQQFIDADKKEKEESRAKVQQDREAHLAKEKKAKDDQEHAEMYGYADEVKTRHPHLPADIYNKIRTAETRGEAKRLVREYLVSAGV